jgi:predicted RNA methylase
MNKPKLLDLNKDWKQARPSTTINGTDIIFSGYQKFSYDKTLTPLNDDLKYKVSLLDPIIRDTINEESSFLDVGCANFYFGFLANTLGAKKVTGVELDIDYVNNIKKIIEVKDLKGINVINSNAQDFKSEEQYDVVNAMAIIHWLYSCSAFFGSLENVINYFSNLTSNTLIIEWISENDEAIKHFGHINYNEKESIKDYNEVNFLKYLNERFESVVFVGNTKTNGHNIDSRKIYVCKKNI